MFKVWNIVDNLLNDYVYGHHLWEPKLLAEELERRGIACRFLGCNSISADYFPGASVVPKRMPACSSSALPAAASAYSP